MTIESRLRLFLSAWQFWMGVAFFVQALVIVALIVQFSRIDTAQRLAIQEQATRIATADAQYRQCLASIPTLRRVNGFVRGVQTLHVTLLENAVATHQATPSGTELYRIQAANLARLRESVKLVQGISFPVPTKADCAAQRLRELGA